MGDLLGAPALKAVPMAILGTKTDLKEAASEAEFREAMGLTPDVVADNLVEVFMCSVIEQGGCLRVGDALQWLSGHVLDKRVSLLSSAQPTLAPAALAQDGAGDDEGDMMV